MEGDADGLAHFLRRAGRTERLDRDQEVELARRIERGDRAAKAAMIESNLLLVVSVARRYRHSGVPLADLIQEGTIGLIRAVEKFDHRRGNRFSTYATFWIRHYVARAAAEQSRIVRLPSDANARLLRLQRLEWELRSRLGRAPTDAELAAELDVPRREVEHLRQLGAPVISIDEPVGADGAPMRELLRDAAAPDPADAVDMDGRYICELLDTLSPRQREVIVRRFGLDGHNSATQVEIARMLGVTRSRVQRIESEALKRLYGHLRPGHALPAPSRALRFRAGRASWPGEPGRAEAA